MDISSIANIAAAYSLRKIKSGYTGNAIEITVAGPASHNIAFNGLNLDTARILTLAGSGDARISKIYDQSGNGRTLTPNSLQGPLIVSSGTLQTAGFGAGTAAASFVSADAASMTATFTLNAPFCLAMTVKPVAAADAYLNFTGGVAVADSATIRKEGGGNQDFRMYGGASWSGAQQVQSPISNTNQVWVAQYRTGSGSNSFRKDGVEKLVGDTTSNCQNPGGIHLGGYTGLSRYMSFYWRDLIVMSAFPSASELATLESGLGSAWTGVSTDPSTGGLRGMRSTVRVPRQIR